MALSNINNHSSNKLSEFYTININNRYESNKTTTINYTSNNNNNYESNFSVFSFQDAVPCQANTEFYFKIICSNEKKLFSGIMKYLELNEIITLKLTCKIIKKSIDKKLIKNYVKKGGLTASTRANFWLKNLPFDLIQFKIKKQINLNLNDEVKLGKDCNSRVLFESVLEKANAEITENKSESLVNIREEINKDLSRTFHFGVFKTLEGQNQLGEILLSLAFIRPEVNYCQGMNFVAGALMHFFDRENAFWFFLIFLDEFEMNDLYCKNMPDYQLRLFQLSNLLKKFLPNVYNHYINEAIDYEVFLSKWILTIFSAYIDIEILYKIWDIFIIDKWKAIFKFIIIFLSELESEIKGMDISDLSYFLRSKSNSHTKENFSLILDKYPQIKIKNSILENLREEFFIEQLKEKLQNPKSIWEADQVEYFEAYQAQIKHFSETFETEKKGLLVKITYLREKFIHAREETNHQIKKCFLIKSNLEELIESKTAFENVLIILNSELITLNRLMEKEREADRGSASSKNNGKDMFTKQKKKKKGGFFQNLGFGGKSNKDKDSSSSNSNCDQKKNSLGYKESLEGKYDNLEKELIKTNKKLNNLLQVIEIENQKLSSSYSVLDVKKLNLDKYKNQLSRQTTVLDDVEKKALFKQRQLLRELVDKLRLCEKFIKFHKF